MTTVAGTHNPQLIGSSTKSDQYLSREENQCQIVLEILVDVYNFLEGLTITYPLVNSQFAIEHGPFIAIKISDIP